MSCIKSRKSTFNIIDTLWYAVPAEVLAFLATHLSSEMQMTEGLLDRYIIRACPIHEVPGEQFFSELFVCAQSAFHSGQFPIYATQKTHKNVPDENQIWCSLKTS